MIITRKTFIPGLRDLFFFSLVSLLQAFLMCPGCTGAEFLHLALFTLLMWILLWKGNSFFSSLLSGKISWTLQPAKRFVVGILVTVSFTVLAVLLLISLFEYFSPVTFGRAAWYIVYGAIIITILISFFLQGRQFLMFWRNASLEREKFEKESIAARYEALKNQVSPHFLFNTLNTLTNLVYDDPDKAARFIKQLSEVYRYVLETREKEVVPLADELAFLESYLFLQQIRFGGKLRVSIAGMPAGAQVAPLALQMLIENAIKHNVLSEEHPLNIALYPEGEFLVVENNLQKKTGGSQTPTPGLGLSNICRRYEFLTRAKVRILEDGSRFIVKLPTLQIPANEYPDH